MRAVALGFLSAACELGLAAASIAWLLPGGTVEHGVAFGAGAGGIEVLFLLAIAMRPGKVISTPAAGAPEEVSPDTFRTRWTFIVERATALFGHAASRGLVWVSLRGQLIAGLIALVLFAAVDAVATYGTSAKWDWLEARTWRRFYGYASAVALIEWGFLIALA